MNLPLVNEVVEAVLYEGYILYPYRPSAKKNRQRFTFGRVYPRAYSEAQKGAEPFVMTTQCLAHSQGEGTRLEVSTRFLQVTSREILSPREPLPDLPAALSPGLAEVVPELVVEGQHFLTWQEAVEREINIAPRDPKQISGAACRLAFEVPASENLEPIKDSRGSIVGIIRRRQERLAGEILLQVEELRSRVFKIKVDVSNQTPISEPDLENQDSVLLRTLASTHTILHLEDAEFISLMDPPDSLRELASSCKNEGTWPVLVGDEEAGDRRTMLSSPIILYDYPKIAAESPGELFDGTEIDEILTLRVMTMTDAEKDEMRQSDPRARRILERTESMPEDQLLKMHGVVRELRPFGDDPFSDDFFSNDRRLEVAEVNGVQLRAGDRVIIRPKSRADIMDMALEGKIATIEAIEQDAESRIHLALVLDDDPGKDLGFMRQPGHRFFYTLDEVEPVSENQMNANGRILVAGIGNIFFGDDAFGGEVIKELTKSQLPQKVDAKDFGIRGYDLAYAIMDGYAATILVDITAKGEPPGTLYLIELDQEKIANVEASIPDAHSLGPVQVLRLVKSLGGQITALYLVACEPAVLETEDGHIGLSEPVQAAVPEAIQMIQRLIERLRLPANASPPPEQ